MEYNFDQLIDRSNTDCEKWDGLKERFNVEDVISMWIADMDFKSPQPVIDSLKQRAEHGVYGYTQRSNSYFESIVNWLEKRHDWKIDKRWISHSPGIIPALTFIINTFTKPGDRVLIQPPVYHHFDRIIKAQDRIVLNNPLKLEDGRYSMDLEDLEKKIDQNVKMLILCNPHNKFLRVLQEREIERVGGNKSLPVNVRVITATHRNLEEMVQNGSFREDLYYRINVIPLHTKLLKDRRDEIPFFLQYFICKHCSILNRSYLSIDPLLEQWLIQYDWPGNIRQLENVVEYMVNMAESEVIGFHDLPDYLYHKKQTPINTSGLSLEEMVSEYEKSIIQSFLLVDKDRVDKEKVANELKISLSTLYRKLERYSLKI